MRPGGNPATSGQLDLARLLLIRNVVVFFIALSAMVVIIAIVSRRGVAGVPTAFSFDKPGQQNPFAPSAYIPEEQIWGYNDVSNSDLSANFVASEPLDFKWYCGCEDNFDPAKSDDLFTRADPQDEKRRREKSVCMYCESALKYLAWKEQQHGR